MNRTCKCGEPIRYAGPGSECEDCLSNRLDSRPIASDPLAGQRRAIVVMLTDLGVPNVVAVADEVFRQLAVDLPGLLKARALQLAGLSERPLKANNTSGHRGVDQHRGKFRARVWRGGRCVWQLSSINLDRVVKARAKYLADNP
jgi:hypothetical protein